MPVIFRALACSDEYLYASFCRTEMQLEMTWLCVYVCVRRTKAGSACFQDVFLEDWVGRAASVSAC